MSDWVEEQHKRIHGEEGQKGGPGSGHHGHAGRPGKRGGSLPGKGGGGTTGEGQAGTASGIVGVAGREIAEAEMATYPNRLSEMSVQQSQEVVAHLVKKPQEELRERQQMLTLQNAVALTRNHDLIVENTRWMSHLIDNAIELQSLPDAGKKTLSRIARGPSEGLDVGKMPEIELQGGSAYGRRDPVYGPTGAGILNELMGFGLIRRSGKKGPSGNLWQITDFGKMIAGGD